VPVIYEELMMNVYLPQPFLHPYPDPKIVFAEPVVRYARHLHPLISIDLSAIDPDWSGRIHMVSPIEPVEEYIGGASKEYWDTFLQLNWIGFKLNADDRYELLGDFRYFYLENPRPRHPYKGAKQELEKHYIKEEASYKAAKSKWIQNGRLYGPGSYIPKDFSQVPALSQIGGTRDAQTLWTKLGIPVDRRPPGPPVPLMPDGRPLRFIASTPGWRYRESGADDILLYFDPVTRTALFTFEYS
jgi:hypothetical protein